MSFRKEAAKAAFVVLAATLISGCLSKSTRRVTGDAQTSPPAKVQREACLALNSEDVLEQIGIGKDGTIFMPADLTSDPYGNVIVTGNYVYSNPSNDDAVRNINHWIIKRYGTDGTTTVLLDERDPTATPESVLAIGDVILSAGKVGAYPDINRQLRRSADRGKTWTILRSIPVDPNSDIPERLRVLPDGSLYFFAAPTLLRSVDNGLTWSNVNVPNFSAGVDVAGDAAGNIYLLGTFLETDGLYHWVVRKSADGAVTWTSVDDFLPTAAGVTGFSPNSAWSDASGAVYMLGSLFGTTPKDVLRKSTDGGTTWVETDFDRQIQMVDRAGSFYSPSGAGGAYVFARSTDAGVTWNEIARVNVPTADAFPAGFIRLDSYGNVLMSAGAYNLGASPPLWSSQVKRVGAHLAATLSGSCLFSNLSADQANPNLQAYEPQYPLWSDGATKRRWIYLPPGKQIDTTDMDSWQFPVGTRLFKEFTRDGKRVETRVLVKAYAGMGLAAWRAATYKWNAEGTEAQLSFDATTGALGTGHNIPNATQCATCHKGSKDMALGFDALQLSKPDPLTGKTFIEQLAAEGRLTAPPAAPIAIQGSPKAQAALGYLHSNCASCHNPNGSMPAFNLKHNSNATSLQTENGYIGTVVGGKIIPGDPANSRVHIRMNMRPGGMPALGSSVIDTVGLQTIDDWILEL